MKKEKISLFIFIDAFGWEILKQHPKFLKGIARDKKPLETILGYSNACDPSIISGLLPSEHEHWSSFYYSPKTSPFKLLKYLKFLPKKITNYQRVRNKLSQLIAKYYRFTGYFQIYQAPFDVLPLFDYAEKKWFWGTKGTLNAGKSIFDYLIEQKVPFYVKKSTAITDEKQWMEVQQKIKHKKIRYAYLFLGQLDAVMHAKGTKHEDVDRLLEEYDSKIRNLIDLAKLHYKEVAWYVFSDHGMHDIKSTFDLASYIKELPIEFKKDYMAFYDSTMARFWFFDEVARELVTEKLQALDKGKILSENELKEFGVYFPDQRYGELVFLMNPHILIIPSFMGLKKIPGMHGYHPNDPDSLAAILSNQKLPKELTRIEQIFNRMVEEVGLKLS